MTKGETELREKLVRTIYSDRLIGQDFDQAKHTVVLVIATLKEGSYFVSHKEICNVTGENWVDWEDGDILRHVWHEDPEPDDEED